MPPMQNGNLNIRVMRRGSKLRWRKSTNSINLRLFLGNYGVVEYANSEHYTGIVFPTMNKDGVVSGYQLMVMQRCSRFHLPNRVADCICNTTFLSHGLNLLFPSEKLNKYHVRSLAESIIRILERDRPTCPNGCCHRKAMIRYEPDGFSLEWGGWLMGGYGGWNESICWDSNSILMPSGTVITFIPDMIVNMPVIQIPFDDVRSR